MIFEVENSLCSEDGSGSGSGSGNGSGDEQGNYIES